MPLASITFNFLNGWIGPIPPSDPAEGTACATVKANNVSSHVYSSGASGSVKTPADCL